MGSRKFRPGAAEGLPDPERRLFPPTRSRRLQASLAALGGQAQANALWCHACLNTGVVDCYCGGDLCICARYGTEPCPACGGLLAWADEAAAGLA